MGGRLLRRWINDPLLDVAEINKRLDGVGEFKDNLILKVKQYKYLTKFMILKGLQVRFLMEMLTQEI